MFEIHGRLFHPEGSQYYVSGNSYLKFHSYWDCLHRALVLIGDKTEYELKIGYGESYWNNGSENPFQIFGGYGNGTIAIFEAIVEFIKWYER